MLRLSLFVTLAGLLLAGTGCPGQKVTLEVSPSLATLSSGATQRFTATVRGSANTEVDWKVKEPNGGSITGSGDYTAPLAGGIFTVVATSRADPTASASASITVLISEQIVVAVSPQTATVGLGGFQTFTATVTGAENPAVSWSVKEANGGTITAAGVYTAPNTAGTFTVVATSAADASKSATAKVTVTTAPVVSVAINPSTVTVGKGSMFPFTAMVAGTTEKAVTWKVQEANGGTIDASGLYTAPATTGAFTVVATSVADTSKFATARVTVTDAQVVNVTITPPSATVVAGATQAFSASVTGTANTAVTWSVEPSNGGTITAAGLYTAPSTPGDYLVIAKSVADPTRSAMAQVKVTQAQMVMVSVSPATATVASGGTQQFTATVTGTANQQVTWSIVEGAAGGTISSTGLYTAGTAQGPFTIKAVSAADPARSGTATVTVTAPTVNVAISPSTVSLQAGESRQFSATVTNATNTTVTWSVQEAGGGIITASGLYIAPAVGGTYHVVATTVEGGKTATATVSVSAAAGPFIAGVISYAGAKTGRIYITVHDANDDAVAGTSIPAPGPFRVRGILSGAYTVRARMDLLGDGMPLAALAPAGAASGVVANSIGTAISLLDPAVPPPTNVMTVIGYPAANAALVTYGAVYGSNGDEVADHYRVSWARSSAPGTVLGSKTVPANGYGFAFVKNLTNGDALLFTVTALVDGAPVGSSTSTAVTIGAPAAGGGTGTISGTAGFSGAASAPGPLYLLAFGGTETAPVRSFARIAAPGGSQAYTLAGVPAGTYAVYSIYDGQDDGVIAPTDPLTPGGTVTVTAGATATASAINAVLKSANGSVTTARSEGQNGDVLSVIFSASPGLKLPVNVSLSTGPNVAAPVDLPVSSASWADFGFAVTATTPPAVGQSYTLTVELSDGSTAAMPVSIAGVYGGLPTLTAPAFGATGVAITPTLSWTAPVGPTTVQYIVRLYFYDGANYSFRWQQRATTTSLPYPTGEAALIGNGTYVWQVFALDAANNYAVAASYFTTAP